MDYFKLVTQTQVITGPHMLGKTAARRELAAIVKAEKDRIRKTGRKPFVFWSPDRLDCTITLGPDKAHSPLWDRLVMVKT